MYYRGIGPERGVIVPEDEAFEYALDRFQNGTPEEKKDFMDVFNEVYYSGNFVKEDGDADSRETDRYTD